jgi:hypothetical protein
MSNSQVAYFSHVGEPARAPLTTVRTDARTETRPPTIANFWAA